MQQSLYKNILHVFVAYRMRFFKAFVMLLISNSLLILNPLVFRQALLAINLDSSHSDEKPAHIAYAILGPYIGVVWIWIATLVLIASAAALFKYWMRLGFITISRDVEQSLRSTLFHTIQIQSMSFYHKFGTGDLLSRLTNDISAYRDVLGPGIMYPLFVLTLVGPGIIALFYISSNLACISLIPLAIIPLINETMRNKIYILSSKAQETLGKMSGMAQEHFSSARIIKSYVIENEVWHRFKSISKIYSNISIKLTFLQGSLFPFFTSLARTTTLLLVVFAGAIILKGWSELSTADFISFMWIQSYIFFPILMLGWLVPIYERGRAAYQRLYEIYQEPIEVKDQPQSPLRIKAEADIEFRQLTFSYPNVIATALNNINLKIKGGSFVGITGPVGAGKTTLFRLLNREYEIPEGMIYIDGHDIHQYPLVAFQEQIVTVEQVPFLFSKSIAENVRFGRREASVEELELVSQYADFHETVLEFPEKYETMVGERGVSLSGGQKQRLAMARAFLVNRSILLLDDVFSAVDFSTEQRIFNSMQEAFVGKTILLATHRVSVLNKLDRVIYMKEGSISEEGPPQELVKKGGAYAALVELQRLQQGTE